MLPLINSESIRDVELSQKIEEVLAKLMHDYFLREVYQERIQTV